MQNEANSSELLLETSTCTHPRKVKKQIWNKANFPQPADRLAVII
jgi:hypothetical protein